MKFAELRYVYVDTKMTRQLLTNVVRRVSEPMSEPEQMARMLHVAEIELLRVELKDHLDALKRILKICALVSQDRYREEWQLCQFGGHFDEHGAPTTCGESCDGFDPRTPHRVIADTVAELQPFSADLRRWIAFQAEYHAKRQQALFGPGGLFGDVPRAKAVPQPDETVAMVPMSEAEQAAARAQAHAHHESVAARMDQYTLNLALMQRLGEQQGPLDQTVHIIEEGMPPLASVRHTLS
jgi:hypothetical protein